MTATDATAADAEALREVQSVLAILKTEPRFAMLQWLGRELQEWQNQQAKFHPRSLEYARAGVVIAYSEAIIKTIRESTQR